MSILLPINLLFAFSRNFLKVSQLKIIFPMNKGRRLKMFDENFDLNEDYEDDLDRFIAHWDEADIGPGQWLEDPNLLPSD